jgi:hypothetical protein
MNCAMVFHLPRRNSGSLELNNMLELYRIAEWTVWRYFTYHGITTEAWI